MNTDRANDNAIHRPSDISTERFNDHFLTTLIICLTTSFIGTIDGLVGYREANRIFLMKQPATGDTRQDPIHVLIAKQAILYNDCRTVTDGGGFHNGSYHRAEQAQCDYCRLKVRAHLSFPLSRSAAPAAAATAAACCRLGSSLPCAAGYRLLLIAACRNRGMSSIRVGSTHGGGWPIRLSV